MNGDQHTYLIIFENASAAEANRSAEELRNILLDSIPDIRVQRQRHDSRTQDPGQILQIILDASSVSALVTAIGNWLIRRQSASLTFKRPEGDVIASNIDNKTVVKLTELLIEASKGKSDK